MDPLRNYLAWQADLGSDEVVLTAPLPPRAVSGQGPLPRPAKAALPNGAVPETAPADPAGHAAPAGDLFQMLVKSLNQSADAEKASKAKSYGIVPPPAAVVRAAEASLPSFANLAECRSFLDKNIRSLLSGEAKDGDWTLVHGSGPEFAPLALAGMEPNAADIQAGRPFQGEAGILLEKMMKAIHLDIGTLYLTYAVKMGGPRRSWTRRDLVRLLPHFHAELALARVPVVLLFGETCAQAVLKTGRTLEELRQAPHRLEGIPDREFVVTYHPDELLAKEDLKRKAWEDLKWLQRRMQGT